MSVILWYMLIINAVAALTLLCYRRRGAKFKRHISFVAGVLLCLTGFNVIRVLTNIITELPVTGCELIWQSALCGLIILSRGNISYLVSQELR